MTATAALIDRLRYQLATAREIGDRVAVILLEQRLWRAMQQAIAERRSCAGGRAGA